MKLNVPANVNNDNKRIGFLALCKEKLIAEHNALPAGETGKRAAVLKEILEIDLEIDTLKNKLPPNGGGEAYGLARQAHEDLHKGQANASDVGLAVAEFIAGHVNN